MTTEHSFDPFVERLAVAMNTAQLSCDDIRFGRDLRVPAARIAAALASSESPEQPGEHEPGESHDYRIECQVCGQRGVVQLSVEPQRAPSESPS